MLVRGDRDARAVRRIQDASMQMSVLAHDRVELKAEAKSLHAVLSRGGGSILRRRAGAIRVLHH